MGMVGLGATTYLALDDVAEDPQVARRLPAEVAWRFHALPVAEDHGRITVAMADPDDPDARGAVVAALGPVACVVRADPGVIDSHLARIWGAPVAPPLDLVALCFPEEMCSEVWRYAQAVSEMLGARLSRADTQAKVDAALGERGTARAGMLLTGDADHASIQAFLRACRAGDPCAHAPSAVWVVPQPRWPVRRILLVLGAPGGDEAAVDWAVEIAHPAGSTVTALAVVPPAPLMYGSRGRMDQGLPAVLQSASPLGQHLRQVARRLVECQIEATLRLRAGPPEWQVCQEIVEGEHDLVVLAAGRGAGWLHRLEGDLIDPLLCKTDRPLLIAAPCTGAAPAF